MALSRCNRLLLFVGWSSLVFAKYRLNFGPNENKTPRVLYTHYSSNCTSIFNTEDNESPDIAPEAPAKDFNAPYFHFGLIELKFWPSRLKKIIRNSVFGNHLWPWSCSCSFWRVAGNRMHEFKIRVWNNNILGRDIQPLSGFVLDGLKGELIRLRTITLNYKWKTF